MSILSSTRTGKIAIDRWEKQAELQQQIRVWLEEHGVENKNYKLYLYSEEPLQYRIKVDGQDVNLVGYQEESLPDYITFEAITGGSFFCSWSNLKTMRGFPKMVGNIFDISHSSIESLEHAPKIVNINYTAYGLNFTKEEIQAKTRVTCNIYC